MNDLERIRRAVVGKILAVNDTCPDERHRLAMRAIVMAAVNEGFDAVANHKANTGSRSRGDQCRSKG